MTLTLTDSTCAPAGLYRHANHCTTTASAKEAVSAPASFLRKEQLPPASADPAATDDCGASGGRKSANWSAAVVAFGATPAARPTAVQLPGTYPPPSPHLGATQLAHIDWLMPRMFEVGAVAAAAPPAATRAGRRYLAGTEKPSSASPGEEERVDEDEGEEAGSGGAAAVHQKSVLALRLPRAVRPETAAEAEKEGEEKAAEAEDDAASQGASEAAAPKTGGGAGEPLLPFPPPPSRLSTATRSPNSALRSPTGLRHPCTTLPGSKENAGPGKPAPQGHVSGSAASGESKEEQVREAKSSTTPRTV